MYHYTYLIQSNTTVMRYIGVRSSDCLPQEDTKYWGSSKHLPKDIHLTHSKIILRVFGSRGEAVEHEVLLHRLNDVAINSIFYNKAKQTSTKFDTTGTSRVFTETHKANLSKAQQRNCVSSTYTNPRQGAILTESTKEKISITKKLDNRPLFVKSPKFSPWFITDGNVTHLFYTKTKSEYAKENGYSEAAIRDNANRSKGERVLKRGQFKGMVIGNIPTLKQ